MGLKSHREAFSDSIYRVIASAPDTKRIRCHERTQKVLSGFRRVGKVGEVWGGSILHSELSEPVNLLTIFRNASPNRGAIFCIGMGNVLVARFATARCFLLFLGQRGRYPSRCRTKGRGSVTHSTEQQPGTRLRKQFYCFLNLIMLLFAPVSRRQFH